MYFYGSLRAVQLRHAEVAEYDLIDLMAVFQELTEMSDGFYTAAHFISCDSDVLELSINSC